MVRFVNPPERYERLVALLERESVLPRIWAHDYTVWKPDPIGIVDRLGWLHAPFSMAGEVDRLRAFAHSVRAEGIRHLLLLGMGGSSLAAETFSRTFGSAAGFPELIVLDSTHPDAVRAVEERLDLSRTLLIVATKSGTTLETLSLFRYFFSRLEEESTEEPGRRAVAITDPGSPLAELAARHRFRELFLNDANIGGRYSALSFFGLVPAALLGVDVSTLLEWARRAAVEYAGQAGAERNAALRLGALLGASVPGGRDKLTLVLPRGLESVGPWIEQLIAESTGKEGTGLLPIVGEPVGAPDSYGDDRLFVRLSSGAPDDEDGALLDLERAGHPVVRIGIEDVSFLGQQFLLWEIATAVLGHLLRINPFDQPNVERAKQLAREAAERFRKGEEARAEGAPPLTSEGLLAALDGLGPGGYVCLQAYLPPTEGLTDAFGALRSALRDRFRVATTFGYGPRFLHSTGQLHKGGRAGGRFVQLVSDRWTEIPIPDELGGPSSSLSFGALIAAQAAGDRRALLEAGRSVVTLAVPADPDRWIRGVAKELDRAGSPADSEGRRWASRS